MLAYPLISNQWISKSHILQKNKFTDMKNSMNLKRTSSLAIATLSLTFVVALLAPDHVYSQAGNQTGNLTGNLTGSLTNSSLTNSSLPNNGTEPCDAAYPDVCIASPPPDLDCPGVPDKGFTVLAPDPHGFDGDGDGVGCEN